MPEKIPGPIGRSLPIWQFLFAHRQQIAEQKFRLHYLDADINQVLTLTIMVLLMMGMMTLADIPQFADVSGLSFGALLRVLLLFSGTVLFLVIRRWHYAAAVDYGVAGFAFLAAVCIIAFHMVADVSAARIGTVGTLFIFTANIAYPVYSLYILPAVLVLLIGDSIVLFDATRADFVQHRPIIIVIFIFAEIMSVFASAHLQRTRFMAFRAFSEIKTLSGMIPICSSCNKIRDDSGYYQKLEKYISEHSDAQFSHGLCPDCVDKLYPEIKDHRQDPAS